MATTPTAGSDLIYGTEAPDRIDGLAGNDTIYGLGGGDVLIGGSGDDSLDGGDGNDSLVGSGNDVLLGGAGNDVFNAPAYNNFDPVFKVNGGSGDDTLYAYRSVGGVVAQGVETLVVVPISEPVRGDIEDFEQFDHIRGEGQKPDLLVTGSGSLDLSDELAAYDGLPAQGIVLYPLMSGPGDVTTGAGDDTIYASEGTRTYNAGAGNDSISAAGKSIVYGGDGDDVLVSGISSSPGRPSMIVNGTQDSLYGDAGNDRISAQFGQAKYIIAGTGDDSVEISGINYIIGDGGKTTFLTGTVEGGDGNDTLVAGSASTDEDITGVTVTGFESLVANGRLLIATAAQFDSFDHIEATRLQLSGGGFLDLSDELATSGGGSRSITITASDAGNRIIAGGGNDVLNGGAGADNLNGGAGNDTISGGGGFDTLLGGAGDDVIRYAYDFSRNAGGTIDGGTGSDTLYADLSLAGLDIKGVETLATRAYFPNGIAGTAAQFESFDHILNPDDPTGSQNALVLNLTGGGTLDLGDELALANGDGRRVIAIGSLFDPNGITSGTGNDTLFGYAGDDTLNGGAGDDQIYGGDGSNILNGGAGDDILVSDVRGTVYGREFLALANDILNGGDGNDTISDILGAQKNISGGSGNDVITIEYDRQDIRGGSTIGHYVGTIDGGAGDDTVGTGQNADLSALTLSAVETLATRGYVVTATAAQFESFDHIVDATDPASARLPVTLQLSGAGTLDLGAGLAIAGGGARAVTVTASDAGNTIITGGGDDRLDGGAGSDVLNGAAGADTLTGGSGTDRYQGSAVRDASGHIVGDTLNGDTITDYAAGESIDLGVGLASSKQVQLVATGSNSELRIDVDNDGSFETVVKLLGLAGGDIVLSGEGGLANNILQIVARDSGVPTAGNDVLTGTSGFDLINGLAGNDRIRGLDANDVLFGGAGNDALDGGTGADLLYGEADNDTLSGGSDIDVLFGGEGADVLKGDAGGDLLYGENGTDTLNGGDDNDLLFGGEASDLLRGDAGNDILYGEGGNDTLSGGAGNDQLWGGVGADRFVLEAGSGADTIGGFNGREGDRIDLQGQSYAIGRAADGDVVIQITGGATIELDGVTRFETGFLA